MKLRWLKSGAASLRRNLDFLDADNSAAAARVRHQIRRAVLRLVEFPLSGRLGHVAGTRELVVSGLPYIVVYRVTEKDVQILRVWHTRQDGH